MNVVRRLEIALSLWRIARRSMGGLVVACSVTLLAACGTAKYEANPDGSTPDLYRATDVLRWPLIEGAHQDSSGNVRIYIHRTVKFDNDVRLGNGVRIAQDAFIDEDVVLFPNVTVGEGSRVGGDAI